MPTFQVVKLPPPLPETTRLPVSRAELARLDGGACHVCGATGGLRDAGRHQYTADGAGGLYGWPVRVCAQH